MTVTVKVGGRIYSRWIGTRVTRGLKRCVSDCNLSAVGEFVPAFLPGQACTVFDGPDLLLTGYAVSDEFNVEAQSTGTNIIIQSKTQDLVDCMLLGVFPTTGFNGYKLDAIARTVAAKFGISVVLGPGVNVGDAFPDATFGSEPAFSYLERLARQRGVLLTDDEYGNLVLTTVQTTRAPGSLVMGQGGNVYSARGRLNSKERFSQYTVVSQAGILQTGTTVQTNIVGKATDAGVTRFRPWAGIAESALLPDDAQLRANWEAAHRSGEAVQATLSVPEWRWGNPQTGPLWRVNQVAKCVVPRLSLDQDYLISEISYLYDGQGKRSEITVAPPSAFSPEPVVKPNAGAWVGLIPVTGQ